MSSLVTILIIFCGFTQSTQQYTKISIQIPEETPKGTRFQNLKDKIIQSGPFSHDVVRDSTLKLLPENKYVYIDDAGYIVSKDRIDRETICHEYISKPCKLTLNIVQQHQGKMSFIELDIEIIDINDNEPSWDSKYIYLHIPEHTKIGTKFALPTAKDIDRGPENTTYSYRIKKHSNDFILDTELLPTDGIQPRKFKLWLKVNQDLDREIVENYQLTLLAMDGGYQSLTGSVTLNITITDINDQKPVFLTNNPTITVPEDAARDTIIFKLKASDQDPSDANRLAFQMGSSANSAILNLFMINNKTGDVSLRGKLDYETVQQYILPVVVTDRKHIVETTLVVNVTNVNDNAPEISLLAMSGDRKFSVKENQKLDTFVATVFVNDGDDKEGKEQIRCHMESNKFTIKPLFKNSNNKFQIVTNLIFDREKKSDYYSKIICADNGQPQKSSSQIFKVDIIDENDNSPYFVPKEMIKEIDENIPIGSVIYKVEARDNDEGENKKIHYSFPVGDDMSRFFTIDKSSGIIRNQIQFNKEERGEYHIKIIARDRGSSSINDETSQPSNSIQGILKIVIRDVNDCPPVFEQPTYHFSVKEGSKDSSKEIGSVSAHDDDVDEKNKRIIYFMKNDIGNPSMEDFRVSPTGQIFPRRDSLDRETTPSYSFYVVARDEGSPPLSTSVNVQIKILDINDNQPQWIFPSDTNRAVNITYRSPVGHQVTKLSAVDRDEGANAEIRYTILESKSNLFELDGTTGALYVSKTMTVNDIGIVKLYIKAQDRGNPEKFSHQVLDVNIVAKLENIMSSGKLASDLIIIIIMVAITLVVSMILIGAILFLRCQCCILYGSKRYRHRRNYSPEGRTHSPVHEMMNSYSQHPHTLSSYMLPSIDSDRQLTCGSKFLCDIDSVSVDSGRGCSSDTTIGKKVDTFSRKPGTLSGTMKSNEQSIKEWAADTTRKTVDMATASRYQSILTGNQTSNIRQRSMDEKQGIGSRARLSVTFVEPEYQTCNNSVNRSEEMLSNGVADDSDTSEERYGHISETGGNHLSSKGLPLSNSCNQISHATSLNSCQPANYSTYTPLQQFQAGNPRLTSPNLYTKLPASFV